MTYVKRKRDREHHHTTTVAAEAAVDAVLRARERSMCNGELGFGVETGKG